MVILSQPSLLAGAGVALMTFSERDARAAAGGRDGMPIALDLIAFIAFGRGGRLRGIFHWRFLWFGCFVGERLFAFGAKSP